MHAHLENNSDFILKVWPPIYIVVVYMQLSRQITSIAQSLCTSVGLH